jgi:antitoxin PrlF
MDTRTTLTVTAKGQVTLKKSLLDHLGVKPGDRITVDLCMPDGAVIRGAPRTSIDAFFGCLPNKSLSVSIDDMNKAIADGWAKKPG